MITSISPSNPLVHFQVLNCSRYSDLAAALVAIALSARELQIYKEVDGIFSADPTKVPTASLLASVSPAEAAELTYFGSEVLHPSTMERGSFTQSIRVIHTLKSSSEVSSLSKQVLTSSK